jgi:ferredoxin
MGGTNKEESMSESVFRELARALDRLANGFPQTESEIELRLLQKIFSSEEAGLASKLDGQMEPVERIAERVGAPVRELRPRLLKMVKRGMVLFEDRQGSPHFRLAPFIVGIYEAQVDAMDEELAHLFEEYMAEGGAAGIMSPEPAIQRVIPAQRAVKEEWILPYDDVRLLLEKANTFTVQPCICRKERALVGSPCDFPLDVCLGFSSRVRAPREGDLTREQALALLDKCEEIGLVHSVSNIQEGLGYLCNCCGCCCAILRYVNEQGIESSVAQANYIAAIDPEECQGCGECSERCQVQAIEERDGVFTVKEDRCIGCGLCVTGCPHDAAKLHRKPEEQILHPPEDFSVWEKQRLRNRGLPE